MTKQTFPAGAEPRVIVTQIGGDLRVRVWDEATLRIETDATLQEVYDEGGTLTIVGCDDDLELRVPTGTEINITHLHGDARIEGVRRVEMTEVGGDVDLRHIAEAVELAELSAELHVAHVPALLARGTVGGDVTLTHVSRAEIEATGTDLKAKQVGTIVISAVGGDLEAERLETALRCGSIGGDCAIDESTQAEITINTIGGDLEVDGAARLHISSVSGDCDLSNIREEVQVVAVGGDASFTNIGKSLQVGEIGADAEVQNAGVNIAIGNIGGDLKLQAAFPPDSSTRLNIGGDTEITLPDNPNLRLQATVGGRLSGNGVASRGDGNMVNLVYGEGAARLELTVGGNLKLRTAHSPRSTSTFWDEVEEEINEFGREMGKLGQDFGREMGKLGQDLGREFGTLFGGPDPENAPPWGDWGQRSRKAERRARRMQQRAEEYARRTQQRAEEHAHHHHRHGPRMHVRFHDREWWFDPERLERIKEQARRAAAEGFSEAVEAVERAISKLHVPPQPPHPEPHAPASAATTGPTIRFDQEGSAAPTAAPDRDLEKEREAILRMVAEGRITPDEGDLLLEALES